MITVTGNYTYPEHTPATVSALALIVLYAKDLSFAQCGINPQNILEIWFGLWLVITGFICPGLTFQRGLRSSSVFTTSKRS